MIKLKKNYETIKRTCIDCGNEFTIEPKEQRFIDRLGYDLPKRCNACRNKRSLERKAARDRQIKLQEEQEWLERQKQWERDELQIATLLEQAPFRIIEKPIIDKDTLVIVGNGFDLAHGIPSSYYSFKKSVKGLAKVALELYIDCEDLWGDFENNLAYLDREKVLWSMWEMKSDYGVLDEEDEDFSAADFFASIEDGAWGINAIINDLPKCFRKWINSLVLNGKPPIYDLPKNAKYLTFNYTETLESVYGIDDNQVNHIHGDRRDEKSKLVLGHGHDVDKVFDDWWNKNKDSKEFQPYRYGRKGRRFKNDNPVYLAYFLDDERKGNWHSQTNYDYIENCIRIIEDYYEGSAKKTNEVIERNTVYFRGLKDIKNVVVIGHSLAEVDMPYFEVITEELPENVEWTIGFHSLRDYKRIIEFCSELGIDSKNVGIFRT